MRISKLYIILIILLGHLSRSMGQYSIDQFSHYTIADGLVNNSVLSITQDSVGYLWIGTKSGLSRFDGGHFENIKSLIPMATHASEYIQLLPLKHNLMGICTENGAYLLHPSTLQLNRITLPCSQAMNYYKNYIQGLALTKNGQLAISTKTGFYITDLNGKSIFNHDHYKDADIGKAWILYGMKLIKDPDGHIIQKTDNGYNTLDEANLTLKENNHLSFITLDEHQKQEAIFIKADNVLFTILKRSGLLKAFDTKTKKFFTATLTNDQRQNIFWNSTIVKKTNEQFFMNGRSGIYSIQLSTRNNDIHISKKPMLQDINAYTIYIDQEGFLWLGSNNGLYKEKNALPIKEFPLEVEGQMQFNSVCASDSQIIVFLENGQIRIFDQTSKTLLSKINLSSNGIKIVNNATHWRDHYYFIGTDIGLFLFNSKTNHIQKHPIVTCEKIKQKDIGIRRINRDKKGRLIFLTNDPKLQWLFHEEHACFESLINEQNTAFPDINPVFGFNDDYKGHYWFFGDGLFRYNDNIKKIDSILPAVTIKDKYHPAFYIDFNTQNDAFIRLLNENWFVRSSNGQSFMLRNTALVPMAISPVSIIDDHMYYVSAQSKLVRLNTVNFHYQLYSINEGFYSSDLTNNNFIKIKDHIYLTNQTSLLALDDNERKKHSSQIKISQIKIGNQLINDIGESITLPYHQHSFTLTYNVIDLHNHANNTLFYRLLPSENDSWMTLEANEINFNKLPASQYTLEIKNVSANNFYPPYIKKLHITILPPWYQTWWFYSLSALLLLGIISLFMRYRIAKIRAMTAIENKISQAEMKALQSQMNPHFVFNCLNSIKLLVVQNETQQAATYLNKFSSLLRSILDESQKSTVNIRSVVKHLNEYFDLEKLRNKDLQYSIDIDPAINQDYISLPSMLIQPLAENAIWHGKNAEEDKSIVRVRFIEKESLLICEIEDFGSGYVELQTQTSKHQSVGLVNIKKRIELLNQQNKQNNVLDIINKQHHGLGNGTIVRLTFEINSSI